MEFMKLEKKLNTIRTIIAILTPVLSIWCLFTLNILYRQARLNDVSLKENVAKTQNRI